MTGKNGNNLLNESETIFLFLDSSLRYENYEKYLKHKCIKIITFDYKSHYILYEKNIPHVISDSFLTLEDMDEIQSKSYDFARWHEDKRLQKSMTYEGINLGLLIQTEFNYFLVPFLKKFIEMMKICSKNKKASFLVSQYMKEIMESFSINATEISKTTQNEEFYYDSVKIPLKIKDHFFSINVSKKNYDRIKNFTERFINLFLKETIHKNDKSVLFVEFDPVKYHNLFLNMNKVKCNFSLYNIRKPSIWNKESFTIIKESNCNIINSKKLISKSSRKLLEIDIKEIKINLEILFEREEFIEIFSLHSKSFWKLIKKIMKDLFEKRISEIIINIQKGKKLFDENNFSSILVWSESGSTEQILVKLAKQKNIPVVLLQHGLFYDSRTKGAYEMNKFQGAYPTDADKYIAWGNIEEKHQIRSGTPSKNIHVLGSPYHDRIFEFYKKQDKKYVLLATSGPVKENALDLTIQTIQKNKDAIRKICQVISKMNKNLVIKIHPSPDEFDPSDLVQQIDPKIRVVKTGDIIPFISNCELFIVIDASTIIIDAQLFRKPIISVSVKDSGYGTPSILQHVCLTDIDNFEYVLKRVLTDTEFRNTLVDMGTAYVNDYLVNHGNASTDIINFLKII